MKKLPTAFSNKRVLFSAVALVLVAGLLFGGVLYTRSQKAPAVDREIWETRNDWQRATAQQDITISRSGEVTLRNKRAQGRIVVRYQSSKRSHFSSLAWDQLVPEDSRISVKARTGETLKGLNQSGWSAPDSESRLNLDLLPDGSFLEVEFTLIRATNGQSPVLKRAQVYRTDNIIVTSQRIAWSGKGSTSNWSEAANWDGGKVPSASDLAIFGQESTKDSSIDAGFSGTIRGIELKKGFTGSVLLYRDIEVTGNIILHAGTLKAGSSKLTLHGNWIRNEGRFDSGTSTVILAGKGPTQINNSTTFYSLSVTTPGKRIFFEADTIQEVRHALTIKGEAGKLIEIRSTRPGIARWKLKTGGTADITMVHIGDTESLGQKLKVMPSNSYGNNYNIDTDPIWDGGGSTNNWSEGNNWDTNVAPGSGDTVTFNGTSTKDATVDASFGTTVSVLNVNAGYTGTITMNRSLTVTNTVTVVEGTISQGANTLTVGAWAQTGGTFTGGSSTITVNGAWSNSGTFTSTSGTLSAKGDFVNTGTFTHNSGTVSYDSSFGTTNFYISPGSSSFYDLSFINNPTSGGGSHKCYYLADNFTVAHNLTDSMGSSQNEYRKVCNPAATKTITVQGDFTKSGSGSTFGGANLTIAMTGSSKTATISAGTFDARLTLSGTSATLTQSGGVVGANATVTFSSTGATISQSAGTWNVGAPLVVGGSASLSQGSTALTVGPMTVASGGTYTGNSYNLTVTSFTNAGTVTAPSGTLLLKYTDFTNTGTFTHNSGTVSFDANTSGNTPVAVDPGSSSFYDLSFINNPTSAGGQHKCYVITRDFTVAHNLTDSMGSSQNEYRKVCNPAATKTITVQGDFTKSGSGSTFGGANLTIAMTGSSKTATISAGTFDARLTLSGTSATLTQSGGVVGANATVTFSSTGATISQSAGTWNVGAPLVVGGSASLSQGSTALTVGPMTVASGGTYTGNSYNLTVTSFTNAGTVTAPSGTLLLKYTDFTNTGTFTHNSGTVSFDANTSGNTPVAVDPGSSSFYDLSFINNPTSAGGQHKCYVITRDFTVAHNLTDSMGSSQNEYRKVCNPAATKTITVQGDFTKSGSGSTFGGANLTIAMTGSSKTATISAGTFDAVLALNGSGTTTFTHSGGTFGTNSQVTLAGSSGHIVQQTNNTTLRSLSIGTNNIYSLDSYNLTIASTYSNNGTLRLRGSETMTFTQDINSGTVEYVGDNDAAADTYTVKETGATDFYNLLINPADSADTFNSGAAKVMAGTLTVTQGTYGANAYTGTYGGLVTVNGGTFTASTATQTLNGGLTISSGTFTGSSGTVDVNGAFNQSGGTVTAPSVTLYVSGDFTHSSGTFTHNSGTVVLDGVNQAVSGTTTFYAFTKTTTEPAILSFQASTTVTFSSTLTLGGTASQYLFIRSSSSGTQATITPNGTKTIDYVDVKDNNNTTAAINPAIWTDNGNNTNWGTGTSSSTITLTSFNSGKYQGGDGQSITWTTTGGDISTIALYYSSNGGTSYTSIATGESDDGTYSWTLPVINSAQVYVEVQARNAGGDVLYVDISSAAFEIDSLGPAAPTGRTVTPTTSGSPEVELNWVDPVTADFDGIIIYRSTTSGTLGSSIDTVAPAVETYTDTSPTLAVTYYYTIRSYDDVGNESSEVYRAESDTLGLWHLDENTGTTANDETVNANDGTLTNGPTWTTGFNDSGLDFDGSNDYVDLGNTSSLKPATALTVEAWIKPSGTLTNLNSIVSSVKDSGDYGGYILTGTNGGKVTFYINTVGTTWVSATSTTTFSAGTWYHVAGTWNGSTLKIYVNNVEEASASAATIAYPGSVSVNATIGRYGSGYYFPGSIDEVRISSTAHTDFNHTFVDPQYEATPSATTISLSAPNGAERWKGGSSHAITWSASGTGITDIALYYTINAGATYTEIATGESNDGTYTWTLPAIDSTTVKVKVQARNSTENSIGYDLSNANFEIDSTGPSLPTNVLAAGQNSGTVGVVLTWTNPGNPDYDGMNIYRSTTLGTQGSLLTTKSAGSTSHTDTSGLSGGTTYYYTLQPIDTLTNETANTTLGGIYTTDGNTTLLWHADEASGSITDTSGNSRTGSTYGTETVVAGKFSNGRSLNGSSYLYNGSMSSGSWTNGTVEFWYKPAQDIRSGTYGIFSTDDYYSGLYMEAQGGELRFGSYYTEGSNEYTTYTIPADWTNTWKHIAVAWNGTDTRLYIDGTLEGTYDLATSGSNNEFYWGSYLYLGYDYSGSNYGPGVYDEVRVSDTNRTNFTTLNQVVAVANDVVVTVTAPNGSENWGGWTRAITWTTSGSGISTMALSYSTDSGSTWTSIATGESNDGTYTWTLPTTVTSSTARVKVEARHSSGNTLSSDTSNANFSLGKTLPLLPTNVTARNANAGGTSIILAWTNPVAGDYDGMRIYRSTTAGTRGSLITTTAAATVTYTDSTGLSNGTLYYYTLQPIDTVGNERENMTTGGSYTADANTKVLWHMDETSGDPVDSSGNNYTTAVNGTATITTGEYSNGRQLLSGAYVYTNNSLPSATYSAGSLEFWYKPAQDIRTGTYGLVSNSSGNSLTVKVESGYLKVGNSYDNSFGEYTIPSNWSGTWKHIAVSWDGTNTKLYVDNTLVGTYDISNGYYGEDTYYFDAYEYLGYNSNTYATADGVYDEFRLSDIARTDFRAMGQVSAIASTATVSVTAPNGSETWGGASHAITWSTTGTISTMGLFYSTDSGSTWTTIATGETNDGTYTWTLPSSVSSTTALVKVEARNGGGSTLTYDLSDAVFRLDTIAPDHPSGITAIGANTGSAGIKLDWTNPADTDFDGIKIYRSTSSGTQGSLVTTTTASDITYTDTSGLTGGVTYYYLFQSIDTSGNEADNSNIGGVYTADGDTSLLWHLNETSGAPTDSSGNSWTGGTSGTVTVVAGKYSDGRSVASSSNLYSDSVSPSYSTWNTGTIEFWYKAAQDISSGTYGLYSSNDSSGLSIYTSSGNLYVGNFGSYSFGSYAITSDWTDIWKHIAVSWDGTSTKLYIDGVLEGTYDISNSYGDDQYYFGNYLYLGYENYNSYYAPGVYDELRLSDVARTDFTTLNQVSGVATANQTAITAPNGGQSWKGTSSQSITWTSSGGGISSVALFYSGNNGSSWMTIATGESDDGSYSWGVPGNLTSTQVRVKVELRDGSGNVLASDMSDTALAVDSTPPAAPGSRTATPGTEKVTLSWTNPGDADFDGIKIYRSTTLGTQGSLLVDTASTVTTSYQDTSGTPGTTYYYAINSYDTLGNESANRGAAGLTGSYYTGPNFNVPVSGSSVTTNFDIDWGTGGPSSPSEVWTDNFSVKWNGYIKIDTAETVTFYTSSNEGSRVYIDNNLVTDNWAGTSCSTEVSDDVALTVGIHTIRYEFFETTGSACTTLKYSSPTITKQVVPSDHLFVSELVQLTAAPLVDVAPDVITSITATAVSSSQINLTWTNPSDDDLIGTNIYRSTTTGVLGTLIGASPVAGSSFNDTGLDPSTTYYYILKAKDATNQLSSSSAEASATTFAGATPPSAAVRSGTVRIKGGTVQVGPSQ